ncbi:hypothetical protein GEOBRER4_n2141 [Citrifermentans bremense]|uniref:Fibronectin type-III domain-containing protein n=1 Tax=Citrifermentans bremense TaxID=60035 RepID=A0A6S6LZ22_9BACT|nr:hypothetical protein [Citrifermentans bremense]BCG47312.1 hypothetical protein GEOBRER4_n2141 [Citrifermentans bremense]
MHSRITGLCLIFVLLMGASALAMDFKTKPKLAFYPLVAKSEEAISFTEAVSTQLFNNIERTDSFEIVERKKVESVLLQDAATIASMSQETLNSVATKAGFDVFIVGTVSRGVDGIAHIDLQMTGSSSRSAYYAESFRIPEFELQKRLQEIAEVVVAKVKGFTAAPTQSKIGCPGNLAATGTPRSVRLKWAPTPSSQVVGYAVLRSTSPTGTFVQIATTTKPGYTDANLKLNEIFYYKVKAISKSGIECELSDPVVGKTALAPLPPIFMDIKVELTGARLNWYSRPYSGSDRNLVTAGYQIYRKAADETDFRSIARVSAGAASYVDNDMRNGVTYSYALTSVNPDNVESEFSSVLESKTAQAAANVKARGSARKVLLTWTPSDLPGIDGYLIYRAAGTAENFKKVGQASGKSASSYQDNGLEDDSTYWYRIAASVGGEESPKSDPVSATTRQRPPAPAAPTASNNEPRRVVLTWKGTGAPEDEVKGYRLYRAAQKDGEFAKVAEVTADKNSYNDGLAGKGGFKLFTSDSKPLGDGTTYWYRFTCFNEAGSESLPSETVSATTRPLLPAPKQLKASSGMAGKIALSWESAPEFIEYEVYRGAVGQNEVTRLKTVKESTYEDREVEHGTSYIYAVKGIDENEIPSLITTSVTGSTKPKPKAPWGLNVKDQGGAKLIQWEPSPEKDVVRYIVYRKNFMGIFQKLQPVYGTSFVLEVGKGTHELRVSAEDSDGLESDKSDVLSVEFN